MNKWIQIFSGLMVILMLSGCTGQAQGDERDLKEDGAVLLRVGAATVPHSELLAFVKPDLEAQGISLEIILIDEINAGGVLVNEQTHNGEYDVNFFQHLPYLNSVKEEKGFDLVSAGNIHVEPIGFYSEHYGSLDEIPEEATFAIPNDATNEYRALAILEENGFIQLKPTIENYVATIQDIETYLKPITLVEMDSAAIARVRDQFDGYITNTNKVMEAGIDPHTVIFREGMDSPYANILTVRTDRQQDEAVVALYNALTSEAVREFIEEQYNGAVIPAF